MKKIFVLSKHPDIDHLSAYIYFNNDPKNTYIIGSDHDKQLNHHILKSIFKDKLAIRLNRLDFKNYNWKYWIFCFLYKRYPQSILRKLLTKKFSNKIIKQMELILKDNINDRIKNFSKNCHLYMDHWNSNRKQDYIINTLIKSSKNISSLPHCYLYAKNKFRYYKAIENYKYCLADRIYFYSKIDMKNVSKNLKKSIKISTIDKYKYRLEWNKYKINSYKKTFNYTLNIHKLNSYKDENTVIFLDTPFYENKELEEKRKNLIKKISNKYRIIIVAHPRSFKLSFNTKNIYIWKGETSILLEKFSKFLGIFTTLSIDLIQKNKLYITCKYLRAKGYKCLDEELGATKIAYNDIEVLKLLKTTPDIQSQKLFLKKLGF